MKTKRTQSREIKELSLGEMLIAACFLFFVYWPVPMLNMT